MKESMYSQFSRKKLDELVHLSGQTIISLYLPIQKSGAGQQQNPIRFANQIKKARELLEKSDLSTHKLKGQLDQAAKMGLPEAELWKYLKQGLAIFITEGAIEFIKLPIEVKDYALVSTQPLIKPLLPIITTNGKFFILTLSQNDIKLYQANRTDIDKLFLGDIPVSMEDHQDYSDLRDHIQHHTAASGAGVFHGQGGGDESYKEDVSRFLNTVENGITELLEGESSPLVLAGVEYLTSMYAKHNRYPHLTDAIIEGNPEHTTKQELHQHAWEIVRPIFKAAEQKALDQYHNQAGTGKTSTDLEEVVKAAFDGKVETLFVLRDHELWGEYVSKSREILLHDKRTAHSTDLIDLCVGQTLANGGNVYSLKAVEMIENTHLAAIYRY